VNLPFSKISSITKKQIVAATGLGLIGYVIAHLVGNFLIYKGPAALNGYAEFLASLRPGLFLIELILFGIFVSHMYFTYLVILENILARGTGYKVYKSVGERSWATRLMPYTGTVILAFVVWHIFDFTLTDHRGPRSVMPNGQSLGLYGIVYNSFRDPIHSSFYIVAMICLGLHLSHAIQSCFQTFGFNHPKYTPYIEKASNFLGFLIAAGYITIPVWVLLESHFGTRL